MIETSGDTKCTAAAPATSPLQFTDTGFGSEIQLSLGKEGPYHLIQCSYDHEASVMYMFVNETLI